MLMEWEDLVINQTSPPTNANCKFWCDTTRPYSLCCDNTWVPPLRIPHCNIDSIDSKVDYFPPVFQDAGLSSQIYNGQRCQKKKGHCYKKVFWSVNMQTTCDTQMNFKNFPFDTQELQMDIYNPYSSRTWLQFVKNILRYNGGDIISYAPPLSKLHYFKVFICFYNSRIKFFVQYVMFMYICYSLLQNFNKMVVVGY